MQASRERPQALTRGREGASPSPRRVGRGSACRQSRHYSLVAVRSPPTVCTPAGFMSRGRRRRLELRIVDTRGRRSIHCRRTVGVGPFHPFTQFLMTSPITELPFSRHTLANGLRVILHPDRSLPLVAINLWYHVGSKNERPGRTGFAHLFEHMLSQASERVGPNDHFRYVQQVGGVANGSTWYDRTNYYETLPAHQLDLGLWLESDRMGFLLPAITAENLETQRQVVMNERRQRIENQPYGLASERLRELLYPVDHPYHWPVIGYMDDIAAATLDEVRTFFRTYYAPNNAVLTLAGDFEPGAALERVDAWFGEIPAGPPVPPLPPQVDKIGR